MFVVFPPDLVREGGFHEVFLGTTLAPVFCFVRPPSFGGGLLLFQLGRDLQRGRLARASPFLGEGLPRSSSSPVVSSSKRGFGFLQRPDCRQTQLYADSDIEELFLIPNQTGELEKVTNNDKQPSPS